MRFDLDDYKRRADRIALDDLDFDAFRREPLDAGALRCIRYMHDVELHTVCYLRDLLLTPAHRDPEITAFLTFWNFEEFWHGEALSKVLDAHDEPGSAARTEAVRRRVASPWAVVATTAATALAGPDFIALHMTWGAINEWTTQAGYARLAARTAHPLLGQLLGRIMRQEGRHIDFYATRAADRLGVSRRARMLTRFAVQRFWRPVGSGVMPAGETRFVVSYLFGDADGLDVARRIDRRIDRLPGLADLHLVERARARVATSDLLRPSSSVVAVAP